MAARNENSAVLLAWSKMVPISQAQDPLGLSLRVSARLASELLHCITSITPRARYFSFLPWCVFDFGRREKPTRELFLVKLSFWAVVVGLVLLVAFVLWGLATHGPLKTRSIPGIEGTPVYVELCDPASGRII